MRFAQNRLYVEAYIKCANCGVLIYENAPVDDPAAIYCSDWCRDWAARRDAAPPAPPNAPDGA